MSRPVTRLRGIGPATASMLTEVDIRDIDTLRRLGAVEAFLRLRFRFDRVSPNALYAMDAGLRGMDWRDLSSGRCAELREAVAR